MLHADYAATPDAKHHVFWMQRYIDPELFPDDLIADYYQSVAPIGYKAVYFVAAKLGINPMVLSKMLPVVLTMLAAGTTYYFLLRVNGLPFVAFFTASLMCFTLWMHNDIPSGTPRAFAIPFFLLFMCSLVSQRIVITISSIALMGLFYPQVMFIAVGVMGLRMLTWKDLRMWPTFNTLGGKQFAASLAVAALVLLPFAFRSSQFGPVIRRGEATHLPEFWKGGRVDFFSKDRARFWLTSPRSGFLPSPANTLPPLLYLGLLLPILMIFHYGYPNICVNKSGAVVLAQVLMASLALFLAAHLLLFELHNPARYTRYTGRIVLVIAAGMVVGAGWRLANEWLRHCGISGPTDRAIGAFSAITLLGLHIGYSARSERYTNAPYTIGNEKKLYKFFQSQPKETRIASLTDECDNLPVFTHRSIVASAKYGTPYHKGYYRLFDQRARDMITAQYTPNPEVLAQFNAKYRVNFWLLDRQAFEPSYFSRVRWLKEKQYKDLVRTAQDDLSLSHDPALARLIESNTVFKNARFVVLSVTPTLP